MKNKRPLGAALEKLKASDKQWYSVFDVVKLLDRGYTYAYKLIASGVIPSKVDVTKQATKKVYRLVSKKDLQDWMLTQELSDE